MGLMSGLTGMLFWEELKGSKGATDEPWVICGDFNAIFYVEDKTSGNPNLEDIRRANAFMHDLGLQELPLVCRRFIWTNGQDDPIWVKLNRFLVNNDWLAHFPRVIQMSLPRLGSDHVLIHLEVGNHSSRLRPFHFELAWSMVEGFQELVHQQWTELIPVRCGAFIFSKKIVGVRALLCQWAKFNFKSIKLKKLALMQDVESMDIAKESRSLTLVETREEQELLAKLKEIRKQEEIYWK